MIRALLAAAAAPSLAHAHPGHGATAADSWLHYLTEPVHVLIVVAAITAGGIASSRWRAARANRDQLEQNSSVPRGKR